MKVFKFSKFDGDEFMDIEREQIVEELGLATVKDVEDLMVNREIIDITFICQDTSYAAMMFDESDKQN